MYVNGVLRHTRDIVGVPSHKQPPLEPSLADHFSEPGHWQPSSLTVSDCSLLNDVTLTDEASVLADNTGVKIFQPFDRKAKR